MATDSNDRTRKEGEARNRWRQMIARKERRLRGEEWRLEREEKGSLCRAKYKDRMQEKERT